MKYFFFSIFILILLILIGIYIKISSVNIDEKIKPIPQKNELQEKLNILKVLADTKNKYQFPAKEMYLKVDLHMLKTKILYQTIITNLDKYKIFGIEQILELNNIRYSIIKSKNDLKLFVNFDKKAQAIKIQKLFKQYNFNVRLKKVTIKG